MLFDKMHPMARFGLTAAIFFVLFSWGGIAAEGQYTDSGNFGPNPIHPISLPAGIVVPPGLEAKAFNFSFTLGFVFFGPDGTAYVFSADRGTQKLMAIDSNGAARTYAESELLSGVNIKTGTMLGSNILTTVDFWPEGGNPFEGIFLLKPDGSYRKWNLTGNDYAGLSRIIPALDGGWYFSDFERDNIWHLSAEGVAETPMITKGDVPPGLGDLAYDSTDGVLYAMNWVGGWPFGGLFAVYKITNDGEAVLHAKVNETSDMNGGMALSTSGPFGHALYVSDTAGGKVLKVDADGITVPAITGLIKPGYMQFNPVNGDLLIVCDDGRSLLWLGSDLSRLGTGSLPEIEASEQEKAIPVKGESEASSDISETKTDNIEIFNNWNQGIVENSPTHSSSFEITQPHYISYIDTYHWNNGQGTSSGGSISLQKEDGEIFGPWTVTAESGSGVANVWWISHPDEVIPAGTYTIIDSEPDTWSKNSESDDRGFSRVEGHPIESESRQSASTRGASNLQELRNEVQTQTVREYDSDGKLLWEVEGYRNEGDQKYKVLKRGSPSFSDLESFILSFLSGLSTESNAAEDGIPICIINDGYQLVPDGKIKSWVTFSGIFETPVVEGEYKNGLKQGHWVYWSYPEMFGKAAVKAAEGDYMDGQKNGHWIYYDAFCKNMVAEEGDYSNGVKQEGTWIKNEYVVDEQGKCVPGKSDASAIGHLTE
jgi:hypothetical protein